jgi:hypothetical protein
MPVSGELLVFPTENCTSDKLVCLVNQNHWFILKTEVPSLPEVDHKTKQEQFHLTITKTNKMHFKQPQYFNVFVHQSQQQCICLVGGCAAATASTKEKF